MLRSPNAKKKQSEVITLNARYNANRDNNKRDDHNKMLDKAAKTHSELLDQFRESDLGGNTLASMLT